MAIDSERVRSALIEYEVDPSKGIAGIKKLQKEIRAEQQEEKALKAVRDELAKQTDTLAASMSKMGQAMAHAGGELMSKALSALVGQMGAAIKQGLEWEDRISGNEVAIGKLREATGGLISSFDLARMRQRMLSGDFKLTESQMGDVAKAALSYSRTMEVDFTTAMEKAERAVVTGGKGMKEFGSTTEFTGTAAEKTAQVLREMHDRFGDMSTEAENTNEKIEKLKNGFGDLVGSIGAAILQSPTAQSAFNLLGESLSTLDRILGTIVGKFGGLSKQSKVAIDDVISITRQLESATAHIGMSAFGPLGAYLGLGKHATPVADALEKIRKVNQAVEASAREAMHSGAFSMGEVWTPTISEPGTKKSGPKKKPLFPDMENPAVLAAMAPFGSAGAAAGIGAAGGAGEGYFDALMAEQKAWLEKGSVERLREAGINFDTLTDAQLRSLDATIQLREQWKASGEIMSSTLTSLKDVGVTALGDLAGGMWQAADAAIQGGESFGMAMAKMLKQTLLSIATQATVQAVFQLAEGFASLASTFGIPNPKATAHFTAAGIYAGVAVLAGGAGLAMSAAGVGASGGGAARASSGASGGSGRYQETPQYGQKVENKKPININLYLGDPDSPSLSLLMQKQLKAQLGEAN